MASAPTSTSSGSRAPGAGTTTRYNYLANRLRTRQITMEEATELFAIMQGMIARANEMAQAAVARATAGSPGPASSAPGPTGTPAPTASSDDLLLVGLLAMGAGAGLLAAMTKRVAEGPPSSTPPPKSGAPSP